MAYSQGDLDALQASMAKGVRKARLGDEEVEFRTLSEMERMEAKIKRELGLTATSRTFQPVTKSGWR